MTGAAESADDCDVLVVGTGPAGAALARRLSASGQRVLMLERSLPMAARRREPVWRIGESLPGAASVLLRRQGLWDRFLADGHVPRQASVSVWDTPQPVWTDALRDPNGPGWHLDRLRFDQMLRDGAADSGAQRAEVTGSIQIERAGAHWWVGDTGTGRRYRASILVDATGRHAAVCRRIGLKREAADRLVALHLLLPPTQEEDRCTRLCADAQGWWYSVRIPSGRRVLCFHMDADEPLLRTLRDAQALLTQARSHSLLRDVLPLTGAGEGEGAREGEGVRLQPAGTAALDLRECEAVPGFYAVGDTVLAFDPVASQGLFHALACAESAALAISRELAGETAARRDYFAEMMQVQTHYRRRLAEVYARPVRFRGQGFWDRHRQATRSAPRRQ